MRIRSIKPDFWRSKDISDLTTWDDRFLFIGLWSYVDDNGVGLDRLSLITTDLFADDVERDPSETFARVSRGLQNLSESNRIVRYESEGRKYLQIVNWTKHQRIDKPNKARYPAFDPLTCENVDIRESVARVSRGSSESQELPSPGAGEQGSRGTGEQGNSGTSESSAPSEPAAPLHDEPKAEPELIRDDVERVCSILSDRIRANGVRKAAGNVTKAWRDSARLMLDRDNISEDEIIRVIEWCQNDEFWKPNIQSFPKFREKFDTLNMQSKRGSYSTSSSRLDTSVWDNV